MRWGVGRDRVDGLGIGAEAEDDLAVAGPAEFFSGQAFDGEGVMTGGGDTGFQIAGELFLLLQPFLVVQADAVEAFLVMEEGEAGEETDQEDGRRDQDGPQARHIVGIIGRHAARRQACLEDRR